MSKQTIIIQHLEAVMNAMWEEWDFQMSHIDIAIIRERAQRVHGQRFCTEMATYIANLNI